MKIWDEVEKAFRSNMTVHGVVLEKVKGGLAVDIGIRAFLPGSQVDIKPVRNLDPYLGKSFDMKVIKVNRRRGNIVLCRKLFLETINANLKEETLAGLEEGKLVEGTVKNITEYGAFIDLGGVDGLLHITDMSWGRLNHPSEMFQVGDKVEVAILKYDKDTERVSLGYKQKFAGSLAHRRRALPHPGHASRARSSPSPTTAHSWSSSPASKAWCMSPR